MDLFIAIMLGIVQGLTEFIPVSSSGHLLILSELFSSSEFVGFEFDVLLNIGTLIAMVYYFRRKIMSTIRGIFGDGDYALAINTIITTVPAAFFGYLLKDTFSGDLRNEYIVVVMLIVVGLIMIFEEKFPIGRKGLKDIKPTNAFLIGLAQVAALIPGTSRSGSTILAGRAQGFSLEASAEYSFFVAIPIISGALIRVLTSSEGSQFLVDNLSVVVVGNIASLVSGLLAIRFMLNYLRGKGLRTFGYYRLGLALVVVLLLLL